MEDDYQLDSEDSFDLALEKFNQRDNTDSVDTLELIKDSSDDFNEDEDEDEFSENDKTISNQTTPKPDEIMQDTPNNLNEENMVVSVTSSAQSSINIETHLNPLAENNEYQLVPVIKNTNESFNDNNTESIHYEKNSEDEIEISDLEHLEKKLRDAYIKMRKLDKKLARCSQKEKNVKRETLALIEKNRVELNQLRVGSDRKESKLETENTAHFLALTYVDLDDEIKNEIEYNNGNYNDYDEGLATPVFKTQVPYDCDNISLDSRDDSLFKNNISKKTNSNSAKSKSTLKNGSNSSKTGSNINKNKYKTNKNDVLNDKNKKVNFIERNIQLAKDEGGALAMTDEEKQRLNELLIGMDQFDTNPKSLGQNEESENTNLVEYNPFSVALVPGDGFTPDKNDNERLQEINTRLERRLSRINSTVNGSIANSSRLSTTTKRSQTTSYNIEADSYSVFQMNPEGRQIRLNDDFDENDFGDKFIREARITREQTEKLKQIELQLNFIKNIGVNVESSMSESYNGDSEIDLESIGNNVVALVDENVIKDLIEEFNYENNNNVFPKTSNKLDTLREEEFLENESDFLDDYSRLNETPTIHDSVLNSLIEQAKNEGICALNEDPRRVESPIQSYYDEALEVIRSNSVRDYNKTRNDENEQEVPFQYDFPDDLEMKTVSLKSKNNILSEDDYDYENTNINSNSMNILPPLMSKNDFLTASDLNEPRSSSQASNTSSVSSINFPKIDSRFLPK